MGYFDDVPHWEIGLALNSRFNLRIGHLGGIAPALRDKILAATGIDTNTYTGPIGNLFTREDIELAAGDQDRIAKLFRIETAQVHAPQQFVARIDDGRIG